ncbi:hypothetical protein [Acanthopleuribacter pedis]|uniref:Uncharacterized protein n=1 Tax=Acanthopleuribacter pedis TaxID=442870 RepID=A0A8J7U6V9_9BACT|nr:hypothetical protein [Acanthopleuribacter pedis]MBO1320781.1 hypothetical protein [Acanthopleuribacter pedis]
MITFFTKPIGWFDVSAVWPTMVKRDATVDVAAGEYGRGVNSGCRLVQRRAKSVSFSLVSKLEKTKGDKMIETVTSTFYPGFTVGPPVIVEQVFAQTSVAINHGTLTVRRYGGHRIYLFRDGILFRLHVEPDGTRLWKPCSGVKRQRRRLRWESDWSHLQPGDRLVVTSGGIRVIQDYDLYLTIKNSEASASAIRDALCNALRNRDAVRETGFWAISVSH